ncbi:MAG TPA: hypothetical protein VMA30_23405, partial [Xanthobacteraceae bacterium]|nr:hypothetical protein [Xanthobacteraceae bacterium]
NGFARHWGKSQRSIAVRAFTLENFFTQYPRSLHTSNPKYNSDNAPLNNYSDDFGEISIRAKREAKWKCQKCEIDLSAHRKFLHTHHKDGAKFDNSRANLKVLCYGCHADEPNHQHMKNSLYREFQQLRSAL